LPRLHRAHAVPSTLTPPPPSATPRYSANKGWGLLAYPLNGKFAWVTQELPALLVPVGTLLQGGAWRSYLGSAATSPRAAMTAALLAHYVHRAVVFPFLIRGGKPSGLITWVLALAFCIYNGYLQVGAGREG